MARWASTAWRVGRGSGGPGRHATRNPGAAGDVPGAAAGGEPTAAAEKAARSAGVPGCVAARPCAPGRLGPSRRSRRDRSRRGKSGHGRTRRWATPTGLAGNGGSRDSATEKPADTPAGREASPSVVPPPEGKGEKVRQERTGCRATATGQASPAACKPMQLPRWPRPSPLVRRVLSRTGSGSGARGRRKRRPQRNDRTGEVRLPGNRTRLTTRRRPLPLGGGLLRGSTNHQPPHGHRVAVTAGYARCEGAAAPCRAGSHPVRGRHGGACRAAAPRNSQQNPAYDATAGILRKGGVGCAGTVSRKPGRPSTRFSREAGARLRREPG